MLGMIGPCPLEKGVFVVALETCYSPTCYHTKFHHSRSNLLGTGRGSQKIGSWVVPSWDGDVAVRTPTVKLTYIDNTL